MYTGDTDAEASTVLITDPVELDRIVAMEELQGTKVSNGWIGQGARAWCGHNYWRMYALHLESKCDRDGVYVCSIKFRL